MPFRLCKNGWLFRQKKPHLQNVWKVQVYFVKLWNFIVITGFVKWHFHYQKGVNAAVKPIWHWSFSFGSEKRIQMVVNTLNFKHTSFCGLYISIVRDCLHIGSKMCYLTFFGQEFGLSASQKLATFFYHWSTWICYQIWNTRPCFKARSYLTNPFQASNSKQTFIWSCWMLRKLKNGFAHPCAHCSVCGTFCKFYPDFIHVMCFWSMVQVYSS